MKVRPVSEPGPDGQRSYRKVHHWRRKPKEEWIAVPVPDAGIPREQVEAARAVVESNRRPARAGRRFWELTGGIAYCGECGQTMCATHSTKNKNGRRYTYDYCTCSHRNRYGAEACANTFRPRAEALEGLVRKGVFAYIEDPERLRADLEYAIELMRQEEARGDAEREAMMWAKKIAEVERKRARYQEMAAEELITLDELRTRLAELGEARDTARRELAALRNRTERIEELERDAEAILESYARLTPDALDNLEPEERYRFYKMLGLKATVGADGSVEIDGTFIVDGPLELGRAFEGSEGERALVSTKTGDKW